MRLQLSSPHTQRLQRLQRVLLSPADHDDPGAWSLRVTHHLATLLRTDKCMLVLPRADGTLVSTIGMEPATRDALTSRVSGVGSDRNRYEDPLLDRKMKRLRQARVVMWNREIAERISRIADSDVPFYRDVMHPAGLRRYDVAGVPTRSGMACLVGFHACREENPFGGSSLQLFRLLRPAFRAGLRALELRSEVTGLVGMGLDQVRAGIAIFDAAGAELHRNRTLCEWLDRETASASIWRAIQDVRCAVGRASEQTGSGSGLEGIPGEASSRTVTGCSGRYHVSGSLASARDGLHRSLVLVTVDRLDRLLPTSGELVVRFGLTEREAEVALLIAEGGSNRHIAAALGISPHTVRNHAQRVFDKLGVHSRKALGLFLARHVHYGRVGASVPMSR